MKRGERKRGLTLISKIPLTQGKEAVIDKADLPLVSQYKWYYGGYKNPYAVTNVKTKEGTRLLYMHRLIINPKEGFDVDHRSTNSLDNRRKNLRECTRGQNQINKKKQTGRKTSSKYKGVYFRKDTGKWNAEIRFNHKCYRLGCYFTQEEAALAYNKKALELHGEFAQLNIIEEVRHEERGA